MKRRITKQLLQWKNGKDRKPLVLKGARQVGKTYSLLEFGKLYYENLGYKCHYIDFRETKEIYSIFEENVDPEKIIKYLQFRLKIKIDTENDLLIFDEIQECHQAITSFKYFEQKLHSLDIIAAGSHLGLLKSEISFPVGKVNFLYMFPMNFYEFVGACDADSFKELKAYNLTHPIPLVVHERLLELVSMYIFTGGMPEVVAKFNENTDDIQSAIEKTRIVQQDLITGYYADFSKYSGIINSNHIKHVFESIPAQLSRTHDEEVKKYLFKDIIPRRKGFDAIRGPLSWLLESRLCIKSLITKRAIHPIKGYVDENKFKMFLFDIGILNCILDIPGEVILDENIGPYKGFILENFIAQELYSYNNKDLISWQEANAELEFLHVDGKNIIPLEVKSAKRSRKAKSMNSFIKRYNPTNAYKISAQNFGHNATQKYTTIPLYCIKKLMGSEIHND